MRKRPFTKRVAYNSFLFLALVSLTLFLTFALVECEVRKNTPDNKEGFVEEPLDEKPIVVIPVVEPEVEEVHTPVYDYTEEELDLLARLIYSECGNESYEVKLMVGSVVVNRMDDPYFPNTLREVIYQKNQFSVTHLKVNGVIMIDRPANEESIKAAYEILNYGSVIPQKVQVFYAKSVKSGWVTTREPYATYGNTVFAYIYAKGENQ